MTEKLQDMENEAMAKMVELEKQLMQRNKDLEAIRVRTVTKEHKKFLCLLSSCSLPVVNGYTLSI